MPKVEVEHLSVQQQKWFASLRDGLQRETGKSLAEWVAIAKTCPESAPRARLRWFKETHGLLQNRASYVLSEAFPPAAGWTTLKPCGARSGPIRRSGRSTTRWRRR